MKIAEFGYLFKSEKLSKISSFTKYKAQKKPPKKEAFKLSQNLNISNNIFYPRILFIKNDFTKFIFFNITIRRI